MTHLIALLIALTSFIASAKDLVDNNNHFKFTIPNSFVESQDPKIKSDSLYAYTGSDLRKHGIIIKIDLMDGPLDLKTISKSDNKILATKSSPDETYNVCYFPWQGQQIRLVSRKDKSISEKRLQIPLTPNAVLVTIIGLQESDKELDQLALLITSSFNIL